MHLDTLPGVLQVLPDVAPNIGGLVHEVIGEHLEGGSEYACRFGKSAAVSATYDAQAGSLLCISPPGLLGSVPVHVTLNGQQYTAEAPGAQLTCFDVDTI